MKFGLISDIHIEYRGITLRPHQLPDCDVMLVAGDIGPGASGIKWAAETYARYGIEVLYIAGNHEFYTRRYTYDQVRQRLEAWSTGGTYYLQDSVREYPAERTVVLGTTMWTDFRLNGNQDVDLARAPMVMNDYWWMDRTPRQILTENTVSLMWLQEQISHYRNLGWTIVVMTHHGPCSQSIGKRYWGNIDNVYYTNTFDQYPAFEWPDFWVHGHMHHSNDYVIRDCRVLSNPRGYVSDERNPENPQFRHDFTFGTKDGRT